MTLPQRISRETKPGVAKRIRSPGHLAYVRDHACCVTGCAGRPIHAHHVRLGADGAGSIKPSDCFAVSLCAVHHDEVHKGEATFQAKHGLNLLDLAAEFARKSPHRRKFGL